MIMGRTAGVSFTFGIRFTGRQDYRVPADITSNFDIQFDITHYIVEDFVAFRETK